ncbi:hypothetical protein CBS101457_002425 [Exobasidium rhododendri]|nr:hypothetical protein CBS101457_002425 [Exobasidium rhododendri]
MARLTTLSALTKRVLRKSDETKMECRDASSSPPHFRRPRSFSSLAKDAVANTSERASVLQEAKQSSPPPIYARQMAQRVNPTSSLPSHVDIGKSQMAASHSTGLPSPPLSPLLSQIKSDYEQIALRFLSAHDDSATSNPGQPAPVRTSAAAAAEETNDDVLLLPQPAFLGGRSNSAPDMPSVSDASRDTSFSATIPTNSRSPVLDYKGPKELPRASSPRHTQPMEAVTTPSWPAVKGRTRLPSFKRRFLSRTSTAPPTTVHISPSEDQRPTMKAIHSTSKTTGSFFRGARKSFSQADCPPTPPKSSASTSLPPSTRTSTSNNSPEMLPHQLPSQPPTVALRRSSQATTSTLRRCDIPRLPASSSPSLDVLSTIITPETEEHSDFLMAVLSLAGSHESAPSGQPTSPKITTQQDANRLQSEMIKKNKTQTQMTTLKALRTIWTRDDSDDSEDEYGDEEEAKDASHSLQRQQAARGSDQSGSDQRWAGLNTPAKKAVYACTVMKFHPRLAASGLHESKALTDISIPRSVNSVKSLQGHFSSYSAQRCLQVGLARGRIVRRLRTERLTLCMEQELEWFIKKYLPHFIAPDQLVGQLSKGVAQSKLEALIRSPIIQGANNGMTRWATRPPFQQRCRVIEDASVVLPLERLSLHVGQVINKVKKQPRPMSLQLSIRCKALAGMPSRGPSLSSPALSAEDTSEGKEKRTSATTLKRSARLAPPWARVPKRSTTDTDFCLTTSTPRMGTTPQSAAAAECSAVSAGRNSSLEEIKKKESEGEEDEEEDVPLALLVNRTRRAVPDHSSKKATVSMDEAFTARLSLGREREIANRINREVKLKEDQRRSIRQARERREKTPHTNALSSPTYGAGDSSMVPRERSRSSADVGGLACGKDSTSARASPASSPTRRRQHICGSNPSLSPTRLMHDAAPGPSLPSKRLSSAARPAPTSWKTSGDMVLQPSPATRLHRSSNVPVVAPHAMMPYYYVPLMPPAAVQSQQGMVMSSTFHLPSTYLPFPTSPLVYLSPEQLPTSARRSSLVVEPRSL